MEITQSMHKEKMKALLAKAEHAKKQKLKVAAFEDWQHKLNKNETLPRGKFFKGKVAGKPIFIMDELSTYFSPEMESNLAKLR